MNAKHKQTARRASLELRPMVDAYLLAMAAAKTWRARMDEWEREELARFEYKASPHHTDRGRVPERILDPEQVYLMDGCEENAGDFAEFMKERQHFVDSLKIDGLQPGTCPACVAEMTTSHAASLLLDAADEFVPGISAAKHRYPERQKAIDLLVGLVVNHPSYTSPLTHEGR